MTPEIVRRLLLESPEKPKEVRTNDGGTVLILNREQWLAGHGVPVAQDRKGVLHHITYWNIASIRHLEGNGKNVRRRK